jgi:hypothetical protein
MELKEGVKTFHATDLSAKLRYPVGFPAPLFLTLRKLLPDSWYFAIVRRSYGI